MNELEVYQKLLQLKGTKFKDEVSLEQAIFKCFKDFVSKSELVLWYYADKQDSTLVVRLHPNHESNIAYHIGYRYNKTNIIITELTTNLTEF